MSDPPISGLFARTSGISLNIAANIAANVVTAAILFVSIPLIIPYIGLEAYGLVGFYVTLQTLILVLELGLNVTITREFAILSQDEERASELRDLLWTAEVFYFGMAAASLVVWISITQLLADFVNPAGLERSTIYLSLLLMGVPLVLQFPASLYSSGLFGIQRQALVSAITTAFSALRNLGVIAVLHYASPTAEAYFAWQAISAVIYVPVLAIALRRSIPAAMRRIRMDTRLLAGKWRFVTGIGIITLASAFLSNVDRLVVARMLPLETFGYYSIAATIGIGINWLVQPVFRALFPRLSQIVSLPDTSSLSRTYHQGCQLMAVVVLPVAGVLIFFSWEVVDLWQRNPETANNTWFLVVILVAAGAANALLFVPWALQLAFGMTRLQLVAMLASLAFSVPMSIVFVSSWGSEGAALVWLILNLLLIFTTVPIAHKFLLPGETFFWATRDVIIPIAATLFAAALARLVYQPSGSHIFTALQLAIAYGFAAACCVAASGLAREWLVKRLPIGRSSD
ncbi:MAG: oligosaccharide flippase family protein [bacterium]|nr:oligosaccharide flippase family protein [bacterium]